MRKFLYDAAALATILGFALMIYNQLYSASLPAPAPAPLYARR
jgi:hypothetical protein